MKSLINGLLWLWNMITYDHEPKRKQTFTHCAYSNTIRLMPQNYCIAHKDYGFWLCDIDAAIKDKLAAKIFITVRKDSFITDNATLLNKLNKLLK